MNNNRTRLNILKINFMKRFVAVQNNFTLVLFLFIFLIISCSRSMSVKEMNKLVLVESERYHTSRDWNIRKEAIINVSKYKTPESIELLITALKDSHMGVRVEAIKGIAKHPSDDTRDILIKYSKSGNVSNIRYEALIGLGTLKNPQDFEIFAQGAASNDWIIREAAISGMLDITDKESEEKSIPYILKILDDKNDSVKISALKKVRIKDPQIYNKIIRHFDNSSYEYKVTMTAAALTALQGYKLDRNTEMKVKGLIIHNNKEIRILALRVIKTIPEKD